MKIKIFFFVLFIFIIGVTLFFSLKDIPVDVIESIGGAVSFVGNENGKTFLYLDVTPNYDSDSDRIMNNDRDVWVSSKNTQILGTLESLGVGDKIYAKDLWKADESIETGINHYYILELQKIERV